MSLLDDQNIIEKELCDTPEFKMLNYIHNNEFNIFLNFNKIYIEGLPPKTMLKLNYLYITLDGRNVWLGDIENGWSCFPINLYLKFCEYLVDKKRKKNK